jgi:hypothetical protein
LTDLARVRVLCCLRFAIWRASRYRMLALDETLSFGDDGFFPNRWKK